MPRRARLSRISSSRDAMTMRLLAFVLALASASCGAKDAGKGDAQDAALPAYTATHRADVLFVVNDSGALAEERAALLTQLPRFFAQLTTGDEDGDAVPDFAPLTDLHVGLTTGDMGNGGVPVPTCVSTYGNDGVLFHPSARPEARCAGDYPAFLSFTSGADDDARTFSNDVTCVMQRMQEGCGFGQPLEAALKALTPSSSDVHFLDDTRGHGDRENARFLRDDALLVIVVVDYEDDCSTSDPALFAASAPGGRYVGELALRCHDYPDVPFPVVRYADGFRALRRGHAERLIFAAFAGVPEDLTSPRGVPDFDAILADPRMQEREETVMSGGMQMGTGRLVPSCSDTGRGPAWPPRRLVSLARELAPHATVASACGGDWQPAMQSLLGRIAAVQRH